LVVFASRGQALRKAAASGLSFDNIPDAADPIQKPDPAQGEQVQVFWSLTAIVSLFAIMFIVTRL
jgi:hypothetical protein